MTAKACTGMVLSQFQLSKITLKNLNKFGLSPTAKLVLLALVDCYNPKSEEIFPKQSTIADQLGISISSVKRAIKELANAQLVIYETKNTNRYRLTSYFFELLKLTPAIVQNDSSPSIRLNHAHDEQKREYINNSQILNFKKRNESNQIPGYLKDIEHAKAILMSYNRFNLKPNAIDVIKQIQDHWNFNIKDYDVLIYLQECQ
jgi:DNA-binding MarR family transcriptional regulator